MSSKNGVKAIGLTSFPSANLLAGYQPINVGGLDENCFLVHIINGGSTPINISYNGVDDHDVVLSNSTRQLNLQTNAQPNNWNCNLAKGTVIYVRGVAGIGLIFVSGYYQLG